MFICFMFVCIVLGLFVLALPCIVCAFMQSLLLIHAFFCWLKRWKFGLLFFLLFLTVRIGLGKTTELDYCLTVVKLRQC